MENRIKRGSTSHLIRSQSSQRLKFKEVPLNQDFNELNSKYELYKQGTPNIYSDDLLTLKARNIKGQIGMLELPAIEYIIGQMGQIDKDKTINHRNFDLYPSLLKNNHVRYKDMLSEKQEVKDFILWFETQFQNIEESTEPATKKFQDKQTLISSGFTEMISQVAKLSKHRAQILKMLWNRLHTQVTGVIDILSGQGIKKQKTLLEQISGIHREYQDQIQFLRKQNKQLQQGYQQQKTFSRACVHDLRILRKRIKKMEYISRKLGQTNTSFRKQNLHLMEENVKLLSNINDMTQEESVVLNYRKLQLHYQKQQIKKHKFKELFLLTRPEEQGLSPLQDLEDKKKHLFEFFQERIKENPDQKTLIKDQYFLDQDQSSLSTIEHYFKTVLNRPNIQIELLNEMPETHSTRQKAVNTQANEEQPQIITLSLEKGVQVEIGDHWKGRLSGNIGEHEQRSDRKIYHLIDEKDQEAKQQQSRMRIIQHRISRKNSLTLLQLQNLGDFNNRVHERKSGFGQTGKKPMTVLNFNHIPTQSDIQEDFKEDLNQDSKSIINRDSSSSSSSSHEQTIILENIGDIKQITSINMRSSPHSVRKSFNFKEMIKNLSQEYHHQVVSGSSTPEKTVFIHLNGMQQQEIKQSQLEDLIVKHLQKSTSSVEPQSIQKSLGKLLLSVYKSTWKKSGINFKFELLDMIKHSYGNVKSVIWKFLNVVTMIKNSENNNPLMKIMSILLKINQKYNLYDPINTSELADLYFRLFGQLSIKSINDDGFNIWKACTTMDKIRTVDFMNMVEEFFSEKKRRYIEGKITQLLAVSQHELKTKKIGTYSSRKRIQLVSEDQSILKLNPLILYIMEVYLIQKQLYHASYQQLAQFITTNGIIPIQLFLWLLEILGFSEEKQMKVIEFILPKENSKTMKTSRFSLIQKVPRERVIKTDMFFRCCVKFDFPIMEQLSVATYSQFKTLPVQIQQKYYRMIGMQEWIQIKDVLIQKYEQICQSPIYLAAFRLITQNLESEIRKGASIYGDHQEQKVKRKEEVFSLFYKILIIESHRNLILKPESSK